MKRILAIDYGSKRVGLAETDDLQIIASAVGTYHSSEIVEVLKKYLAKHQVETIVLGEPKNLDNTATDSSKIVMEFKVSLQRKFPEVNVVSLDERFTSKLASQTILASGVNKKKRQNKGLVDTVSAVILLQDYLIRKSNGLV